jgi:hypothetical protein
MNMFLSCNIDFSHVEMESALSFQRTIIFGISLSVHGVGKSPHWSFLQPRSVQKSCLQMRH